MHKKQLEEPTVQAGEQSTAAESTGTESSTTETAELGKITVGVCADPYGDMFEDCIAPSLHELGYETEVIEISDIVKPIYNIYSASLPNLGGADKKMIT